MSPYLAYFIGLITVIIVILIFALVARTSRPVAQIYNSIFCVTGINASNNNISQ